jgi:type I restriction enzyme S subunit
MRSNHFLGFANVAVAGVKMPRIIMAKFWEHRVPLPSLSEQRRIVEILDQAAALRKRRAEADTKAARILPARFNKMFGDLATNPKGWQTCCLADVAVDLRYGTSAKCDSRGAGLPVLRIPNVVRGRIDLNDLKYADLSESEVAKLILEDGDLLFVRTNGNREYVGRCAFCEPNGDILFASYLIRVRLDKSAVDPKFVAAALATPMGRQAMSPFIRTTAGQSNISQEGLRQIPLILPPLNLQKRFRQQIEDLDKIEQKRRFAGTKFEMLFQTLLQRAFIGVLTSKWREMHMKELLVEMENQAKALEE